MVPSCLTVSTDHMGAFHLVHMHRGGGGGEGFKPPIHFHCVLHAKRGRGGGVQKACKIAYILNGRPHV